MVSCVRPLSDRNDTAPANSNERGARSTTLESRRREIRALLEEIRAPQPTPTEIIRVVEQAGAGTLDDGRLDRIAADIRSLYRTR